MATIEEQKAADKIREAALIAAAKEKIGEAYKHNLLLLPGRKRYGGRDSQDWATLYTPYLEAKAIVLMAQEDHRTKDGCYDSSTQWLEIAGHVLCEVTVISTLYGSHQGTERVEIKQGDIGKAFESAQSKAMARALNFAGGYGLFGGEEMSEIESGVDSDTGNGEERKVRHLASTVALEAVAASLVESGIDKMDVGPFLTTLIQRMPESKLYEDQATGWLATVSDVTTIPISFFDQYLRFLCKVHKKPQQEVKEFIDSAYDGIPIDSLERDQQQKVIAFIKEG